ncbi:hypothetical protein BI317_10290 [Xanthomonas hortorum pv. gardneri]|nr:hypothetical protein BI317_10290 [Xanthomonas hortorum pv. gardneri]
MAATVAKSEVNLPKAPNYYWTAEMRCCTEYLRSLALCEWGNPSRYQGITRQQADSTFARFLVLSSKDTGV